MSSPSQSHGGHSRGMKEPHAAPKLRVANLWPRSTNHNINITSTTRGRVATSTDMVGVVTSTNREDLTSSTDTGGVNTTHTSTSRKGPATRIATRWTASNRASRWNRTFSAATGRRWDRVVGLLRSSFLNHEFGVFEVRNFTFKSCLFKLGQLVIFYRLRCFSAFWHSLELHHDHESVRISP